MVIFSVCQKKMVFWVFLDHPPMASVLLSASVERCFVSRMRDFFPLSFHIFLLLPVSSHHFSFPPVSFGFFLFIFISCCFFLFLPAYFPCYYVLFCFRWGKKYIKLGRRYDYSSSEFGTDTLCLVSLLFSNAPLLLFACVFEIYSFQVLQSHTSSNCFINTLLIGFFTHTQM